MTEEEKKEKEKLKKFLESCGEDIAAQEKEAKILDEKFKKLEHRAKKSQSRARIVRRG